MAAGVKSGIGGIVKLGEAAEAKPAKWGLTKRKMLMPSEREKMESWPLKAVFDSLSNSEPGTIAHTRAMAEIQRRSMEVERSAFEAQQKAANAASDAAKSARLSARYGLGALVLAAISIIVSIVSLFHK